MSGQDYYMYSYNSRFSSGMGGGYNQNRMGQAPFQMATSAQHRQFHQMKAQMPSDVLQLFKSNQIKFVKAPVKPKCRDLDPILNTGLNLMEMFQIPNFDLFEAEKPETKQQRHQRIAQERKQKNQKRIQEQISKWNPFGDTNLTADPQKTLLVARLSYKTTQKTLKFQFEKYGIIKQAHIVTDKEGNSRGYGFIEFDSKQDFLAAYKQGNNRKIDGHKVIVDFEKGRTLLNWRPRRFGEGQGNTRMTKSQRQQFQAKLKMKKVLQQQTRQKEQEKNYQRERSRDKKNDDKRRQRQRQRGYGEKERQREREKERQRERQRRYSRDRKEKEKGKEKKDKKDKKEKKDRQRELGEIDI